MKILILYHSLYGHILKMAQSAKEGAALVNGIEVVLRRAPDFPEDERIHNGAPSSKPMYRPSSILRAIAAKGA
jgi:multimeric flavodoxin WrbA